MEHIEGEKIIQWVTEENVPITITKVGNLVDEEEKFNPDSLTEIKGMAEKAVNDIENDQIVQFERFGFCRMDDKEKGKMIFVSK
ncbi:MAG: glutamyl-tRNA synthetase [Candidatus Parvarchaeum acidophilus ARMAN-5]|uniref:Glutamyl-tRNA synthetase n=1 Tax=Candidatus Parvarchaeum acidophilus ARMAN-5 TaxID=662762 RepID=D6GVQ4_PARA5|nr:MAG: glutamyl-tRNA synthetase [Candidatus Parvarchaeum acidophilus ARMAN-5]